MKDVTIIDHPLVQHYLSILRDKTTGKTNYKYSLKKISYLHARYVYSSLELKNISISIPLKRCKGKKIKDKVVILPLLRAGLGFTHGFVDF
jgi:uracil phosphoribosyltransferase